ncbi:hypothetical protein [Piscinibacter gummiphilus]|uniref:RRXRR domain-containing protein n=1 Tax=Piscinibacter gummiphilus TaxID=946333 RepID=A0ABZ0CNE7_9BURK|nr:hypothetical protein [Piscinibacter gummiphilus]WOB06497.1 hypothetical protein RXV79_16365 [Piscinibacter gummiphilus]
MRKHKPRIAKNPGCVYTGQVGRRMSPPKHRLPSKKVERVSKYLVGGPLDGCTVRLDRTGGLNTLPILLRGQAGRYVACKWVPA